ncbi:MAG TPA: DUF2185 domain-containing protein [Chthoniobacteraceae bacterium]|nr:DUF2185 domain-containing protein [Chthoniobacteraceae bacterium]
MNDQTSRNPYSNWPAGSLALISKLCIGPNRKKIRYMSREEPQNDQDSGWILFSGEEPMPLKPSDFVPTSLTVFIREDSSLEKPLRAPVGTEWTRKPPEDVWLRIIGDDVVNDEGRVVGRAK